MRIPRILWLLVVPLSVAGCRVDQQKEIATYRQIVDQPGQAVVEFMPGQPLTLEKSLALANLNNERIGVQGENYLQALIAKDRAAANFMPQIALSPSYFKQQDPGFGTPGSSDGLAHANDHTDVPVTGRMNVFNGFTDLANYQAAGRNINQRRALLLDAQAAVLLDVARTYYQVLRSEQSVVVLNNSLATQDERVRDIRTRNKVGFARLLDVAQTESQTAATRVSLLAAQNDVANGRAVLSFLLAVDVGKSPLADDATVPGTIAPEEEFQQLGARSRQDLIAAVEALEAAKYGVTAAVGQYYPSVTLNLAYYLSRQSLPTESDWNALLTANLPIFSAGLIEASVRQAWSLVRQAKMVETSTRREVVQDVDIAYQSLISSRLRLHELQVQLAAAAEALHQAEVSYRAGLATNLERLTAQDSLLSAQLQLTSERYNQKVAYLTLLRAAGTLSTRLPGEATTQPVTQPATLPTTQPSGNM